MSHLFLCDNLFIEHIQLQVPYMVFRGFHKVGTHKLPWIYAHYFPSVLSNTIFLFYYYPFPIMTLIINVFQVIISLNLPTVISRGLNGHLCISTSRISVSDIKFLPIESYGIIGTIPPYIMFLYINQMLVFVLNFVPLISFGSVSSIVINHYNFRIQSALLFLVCPRWVSMHLWHFHFSISFIEYAMFLIYLWFSFFSFIYYF